MTTPPKPRGRPRVDPSDESITVTVTVPARDYRATVEAARRERLTVGDWLRQTIRAANAPFSTKK
jgi:hypothetical protein